MAESTQDTAAVRNPSGHGWCAWHENYARDVRLISVVEQSSGSGWNLFACRPCRQAYELVPFADRP
ncbi:hypothetical protein [Streptomyces justiciae]|uniref:hypothetical protein n=1 Tax=Streptomyces justiciae TaxID=2780140 RepID=UPI00187E1CE7|nr:hypothetical protein [Streptomyces justiciae]MBE8471060.1 hypothetical protein [Streptomyces justiciae]